jgi:putative ABC transport system ATP-binding protein
MSRETILAVRQLTREYATGREKLRVLDDVSFELRTGDSCAILGPSGSGKTTLLGLCAGLDHPSAGSVLLDGQPLEQLDENQRARLRNAKVGFVFQSFRLLPNLTALENVMTPLELQGLTPRQAAPRAAEILARVGLAERTSHYPAQLSGGEQQRVALARAFVHEPRILFADEPTGNLDAETGHAIIELLFQMNQRQGTTLVLVTHDIELAGRTGQILRLRGGRLADPGRPASAL